MEKILQNNKETFNDEKLEKIINKINNLIEILSSFSEESAEELDELLKKVYQKLNEMQLSRFGNIEKGVEITNKTPHDINDVISGIYRLIELLSKSDRSGKLNDYLEEFYNELNSLHNKLTEKEHKMAA